MPCYTPLTAYRSVLPGPSGKPSITFNRKQGYVDLPITLPCGQCVGCRLERSRQWAIRCVHEAQMHDANSFITLTYDQEHLPPDGSLNLREFQLFMKKLRKFLGFPIRFFHCGEYGDKQGRPHYHALIFGYDFPDKTVWDRRDEIILYRSKTLEKLWPIGFSTIGEVTFESAAYCARYIMKKITGQSAWEHYTTWDPDTGEVLATRTPEYTTMSRGGKDGQGGIGRSWLDKYEHDVYPSDEVIMRGRSMRPPQIL